MLAPPPNEADRDANALEPEGRERYLLSLGESFSSLSHNPSTSRKQAEKTGREGWTTDVKRHALCTLRGT